jgi:nucleotidyltransferase/DNA polymerase involved in DNA repair
MRLFNFQQILAELDKSRGMLNLGGTILKAQFGTVTVTDLHQLHRTIDELKSKKADIVHSLPNPQTYVRGLDHTTRINTGVISNLSTAVKHELVQSHDHYVQLTRDMWLNVWCEAK